MNVSEAELDLSIIIVNWNTRALLAQCLRSVYETAGDLKCEVIVVDNASTDGSAEMVSREFPSVRLVRNSENIGFARANNTAMAFAKGRYMLLLNSDTIVTQGALQALVRLADRQPRAGIIGAQLLNVDGSFQASYTSFPNLWQEFLILSGLGRLLYRRWYPSHDAGTKSSQVMGYVEGACLLVRPKAVREVGGLDESYFMYAEEVDWCFAMKSKGWQIWYEPEAKVIHLGGGSSQNRKPEREGDLYRSRIHFMNKNRNKINAMALKFLIYFFVSLKIIFHAFLRLISDGRVGRQVISIRQLSRKLSG